MSYDAKNSTPTVAAAVLAADKFLFGSTAPGWQTIEAEDLLEAAINRSVGRLVASGATGLTLAGTMTAAAFVGSGAGLTGLPASSGGFPFPYATPTDPTAATLAWVNQGTASVATAGATTYLSDTTGYNTENLRIRKQAAPATPYTVTLGFAFNVNYLVEIQNAGIVLRNSGSGKCVTAGFINRSNGGPYPCGYDFTDATTFSATNFEASIGWTAGPAFWVRVTDDGTNRKHYTSVDGTHWALQFSEGRTTFMTADEVGFYTNPIGSGGGASRESGIVVFSYAVA